MLELSIVRREEWLAQTFRKDLTERNLEKTRMKIMLFSSPSWFSTKSSQYQIWKSNTYSILTVIKPGPQVLESSPRVSKIHDPTDSEHKFQKTRIENWLSIGFELGIPWKSIVITTTPWSTSNIMNEQSYTFIYRSSKSWKNPGDLSLHLNCTSALKIHTQCPEQHQTQPNKTQLPFA